MSLPLLERVRPGDPARLAGLAPLDVLLLERLAPSARTALPPAALLGLLEAAADAEPPAGLAALVLGPAARFGSERALLLELAARAAAAPEALRWLQLGGLDEVGEVLASPPVAAELVAAGGRRVGGPGPPVFDSAGDLLTRI